MGPMGAIPQENGSHDNPVVAAMVRKKGGAGFRGALAWHSPPPQDCGGSEYPKGSEDMTTIGGSGQANADDENVTLRPVLPARLHR
jgi:hypothetical protein